MTGLQTIGDLYEAKAITEADLVKAVDAYMADPKVTDFLMSGGYTLDVAEAVQANAHAQKVLDDPEANMMRKRGVILSAILLAQSVKR